MFRFAISSLAILLTAPLLILQSSQPVAAQVSPAATAPTVDRVEPPSWWTGSTINPLRVLLHGRNLTGARLETGPGLTVSNIKTSASGTYLFADLAISPSAVPGDKILRIVTPAGAATARFAVERPLPTATNFQGITPDDVIYLIMPDRFANGDPSNDTPAGAPPADRGNEHVYHGGDLQGIIDHLPYLKDLGVTAIWINPIYQNYIGGTDFHGYSTTDFYAVDPHLGTLAKYKELVSKAHTLGLKIVQDQVANHCGIHNPWTDDPPTPTWYHGTVQNHMHEHFQIWTEQDAHALPGESYETLNGWFNDAMPDLDQEDPEVARYEIQNAVWWVGISGEDGIRQDTMPYVPRWFWNRWNTAITREFPKVDAVGEVWDQDVPLVAEFQGGRVNGGVDTKMRSLFDYPAYLVMRKSFAGGDSFHDLVETLGHDNYYPDPNALWTFIGNHDLSRFMSENGATPARLELADDFLLTSRGTPLIYYGDEIGMPGGNDPDNRRDFPGGWPGDVRNAFTAGGRTQQEEEIFRHVRALTRLRAEHPALRRGKQTNLYYSDHQWAYLRSLPGESVVVALNNDSQPASITIPMAASGFRDGTVLIDRLAGIQPATVSSGAVTITVPANQGVILTK